MTRYQTIRNGIEQALKIGKRNFIIYPFGENGLLTKEILNKCFGITESFIADKRLSEFNPEIKSLEYFFDIDKSPYTVLLTIENPASYEEIHHSLEQYFSKDCIIELFAEGYRKNKLCMTKCGKYSYGPLCNHQFVESVGAFCSFALGTDVLENHPYNYLSTHPFMYADRNINTALRYTYDECNQAEWYFAGIAPRGVVQKFSKVKIGNDVWLGKNVLITNGSNIGNGVIAGAGAVITKDVPDYAVVAGVPARIVRYRYTSKQIEKLNHIAWWNWSDDVIRERYDDFYIDIKDFIEKYDVETTVNK